MSSRSCHRFRLQIRLSSELESRRQDTIVSARARMRFVFFAILARLKSVWFLSDDDDDDDDLQTHRFRVISAGPRHATNAIVNTRRDRVRV